MGSACLFFALAPPRALLGDINPELIHTFKLVARAPVVVHEALRHLPVGKAAYYRIRSHEPDRLSASMRAARFIYLNRLCFNGLYRTNNLGAFNVPYSASKTGQMASRVELRAVSRALRNATVIESDYVDTLSRARKGDFVYLDPPYAIPGRRQFLYAKEPFTLSDLDELARQLEALDKKGAYFLLSYAKCKELDALFSRWNVREARVHRNISGFAQHRRRATELLITNYEKAAMVL